MSARSYSSFLGLASGELLDSPMTPKASRLINSPGVVSDLKSDKSYNWGPDTPPIRRERKIIVANMLPLHAQRDAETGSWKFCLDEDSLLVQLKAGLSSETEVLYVGSLKVGVEAQEQEEVAQKLFEEFGCVPTFLPPDLHEKFYHGFCKQQLWPLFHYMLPISPDHGDRFDRSLWHSYVSANKIFADKIMGVMNQDDCVWIHDYHLMVLPTFLRKRFTRVKLGFFLHSPFPTSEIYRTLPVRDEIIKALLNCDLIGFHTFDYARHFLSCCSRMLGLDYECKRGYIGLEYFGRTIYIKILPVGIHLGRLESILNLPSTINKARDIKEQYKGKMLFLGVDDMDIFKGISLKLLAMEHLLKENPSIRGELVLIQIVNPARSTGKDVQETKRETYLTAKRINETYGSPGYDPVVLIDHPIPLSEKVAFYAIADCCIVNAVRDGMNLVPYEYIVCRQGTKAMDEARGKNGEFPHVSKLIVSEFVGCSPSLSGAIRINPWNIDAVADALNSAVKVPGAEEQLRHEKHYKYVSTHDVGYWGRSFIQDLERACNEHNIKRCWGIGFGLGFRVIALSPNFRKLSISDIISYYNRTSRRAIFLDYDGTIVPQCSIMKAPRAEVISVLNDLCGDPKNTVFIVSGRGKNSLSEWFDPCEKLGLAAEHGYFIRWGRKSEWEISPILADFDWKRIAEPVMRLYTETTDGSNIETKESALVWHHQDADPDFGSCQAKELLNHLENVLANDPVVVKRGQQIVEVKPQGISKGMAVQKILSTMVDYGMPPDFVMCIGDDRSDEDMFEDIAEFISCPLLPAVPEFFACTVGQKPSKAKYYLDDAVDVMKLLQGLAGAASNPEPRPNPDIEFLFDSYAGEV